MHNLSDREFRLIGVHYFPLIYKIVCALLKRFRPRTLLHNRHHVLADPTAVQSDLHRGHHKCVEVLLADVRSFDLYRYVVGEDKLEVVEYLVKKVADVNARADIWYQTPLSQSLTNAKIVELLVKAGAKDIDAAFMSATSSGQIPIVKAFPKNFLSIKAGTH